MWEVSRTNELGGFMDTLKSETVTFRCAWGHRYVELRFGTHSRRDSSRESRIGSRDNFIMSRASATARTTGSSGDYTCAAQYGKPTPLPRFLTTGSSPTWRRGRRPHAHHLRPATLTVTLKLIEYGFGYVIIRFPNTPIFYLLKGDSSPEA